MFAVFLVTLLVAFEPCSAMREWALLVSGAPNVWSNYGLESTLCAAYQQIRQHGIPEERIVLMLADFFAHHPRNVYPGKLFSRPGGPDEYKGIQKDYVGKDVTAENFLRILSGDKEGMKSIGSGKVIDSNKDDHVFVFYLDHGGPQVLVFPFGPMLTARQLNQTLYDKWQAKKYDKMLIYITACFSGSMFYHILDRNPQKLNIYAVTAANHKEYAHQKYFNRTLKTYLSDDFSDAWLRDSRTHNLSQRTLREQYRNSKENVHSSHVTEFGRFDFADKITLAQFQGDGKIEPQEETVTDSDPELQSADRVIALLRFNIEHYANQYEKQMVYQKELEFVMAKRHYFDTFLKSFVGKFEVTEKQADVILKRLFQFDNVDELECHEKAIITFERDCLMVGQNIYTRKVSHVLGNLCQIYHNQAEMVVNKLNDSCFDHAPFPENII